ncbi:MAG: hypothetical protein A2Y24_04215 [Clostridiales bacterium GWE2_32_10]|nr:MAG: hypothetical protein A2Y24_04215 [Clostridiales bacterium GWE2_32_10]
MAIPGQKLKKCKKISKNFKQPQIHSVYGVVVVLLLDRSKQNPKFFQLGLDDQEFAGYNVSKAALRGSLKGIANQLTGCASPKFKEELL